MRRDITVALGVLVSTQASLGTEKGTKNSLTARLLFTI